MSLQSFGYLDISQDEPLAMSYELGDRSFDNEIEVLKLMARSSSKRNVKI